MLLGCVILAVVVAVALVSPYLTRTDPSELNPFERLQPPSADHWFGADHLGRDVFDRTLVGSRVSLLVGFSVGIITSVAGLGRGLRAGYYRRRDNGLRRFMDGLMAFPMILLAIAMVAILGASMQNVIVALVVVSFPRETRVVRASVLSLREQQFVDAARAIGARTSRILAFHIFPSTVPPLIIQGTFTCALAILTEATLSFLGAGISPDVPSWGNMMAEGNYYVQVAIWVIVFPGVALGLTVMGVSLAGDGLRDLLDPRISRV